LYATPSVSVPTEIKIRRGDDSAESSTAPLQRAACLGYADT
jgi:hypothetical protein